MESQAVSVVDEVSVGLFGRRPSSGNQQQADASVAADAVSPGLAGMAQSPEERIAGALILPHSATGTQLVGNW